MALSTVAGAMRRSWQQAKGRQTAGRNGGVGELAFERLPQSFIHGQARAGCFPPCPVCGEEVGKERRMAEGAISSFSNGVHGAGRKAGEHEIHVQQNQH